MSNRTNRTLSANTLRLNLGTRSFAQANLDSMTLTVRPASHPGAVARVERMRFMAPITLPALSFGKCGDGDRDPAKRPLDSSPRPSWPYSSSFEGWGHPGEGRGQVVVAEAPPEPRTVVVTDVPSGRSVPRQAQPTPQAQATPARACRVARAAGRSARASDLALASAVAS
jgi:hypothetical protein